MKIRIWLVCSLVVLATWTAEAAPVFQGAPVDVIDGNAVYTYGVVATDALATVTVDAVVLPSWLTLSQEPGWRTSTLAGGQGEVGFIDGTGANARFKNMYGVITMANGDVFVADTHNHAIRHVDGQTGEVTTVAGNGEKGFADGLGAAARFHFPQGIAADSEGTVYVADAFNHCVRRIDKDTWEVTTIAGISESPGAEDGGSGTARFNFPKGIAVDTNNEIWVADSGNHSIRKIAEDDTVTTIAGASGTNGNRDGSGSDALFNSPRGMGFGPNGMLFIADKDNHQIRALDPTTGQVTTIAGSGTKGNSDGIGIAAAFWHPFDVVADAAGNLYVVDSSNHQVRRIDATTAMVTTEAGTGWPAFAEGTGTRAQFYFPRAITMAGENLIVSDRTNGTIRMLTPTVARLVGTAAATDVGNHPVQLLATSSTGTATQSFTVNVTRLNERPVIAGSPAFTAVVGQRYSFIPSASDADNSDLTFSVFMLPAWASFDPSTGEVFGVPTADDLGLFVHVAVTVDDQTGADNSAITLAPFNIRVEPAPDGRPATSAANELDVQRDHNNVINDTSGCSSAHGSDAGAGWLLLLLGLVAATARRRRGGRDY